MPIRCVNLEASLLTNVHQVLTLCMLCFRQGLNGKQMTHLKENNLRKVYLQ